MEGVPCHNYIIVYHNIITYVNHTPVHACFDKLVTTIYTEAKTFGIFLTVGMALHCLRMIALSPTCRIAVGTKGLIGLLYVIHAITTINERNRPVINGLHPCFSSSRRSDVVKRHFCP